MKHKAYLLMVGRTDTKLNEHELREIHRIVGDDTCPLMAWDKGIVVGFIAIEPATKMCEKIRSAVGDRTRISVLELGPDQAQIGLQHHNKWFAHLSWLTKSGGQETK